MDLKQVSNLEKHLCLRGQMSNELNFKDYKGNTWTLYTEIGADRRYFITVKCNGKLAGKPLRFSGRLQYEEYIKEMLEHKNDKKK